MPPLSTKRTNAPEPIYPDVPRHHRRQVTFEVPLEVHRALEAEAKRQGISVTRMVLLHCKPWIDSIHQQFVDDL